MKRESDACSEVIIVSGPPVSALACKYRQTPMHSSSRPRLLGWFFFLACAATTALRAQTVALPPSNDSVDLQMLVVSASRTPQDPRITPSSVAVLSIEELAQSQVVDLHTALAGQPGINLVNTGSTGGGSAIFLRGASPHQTLLVVDGVRMNDRTASYANFLAGADLGGVGHLEVLRGAQSTLYGSSAMGGVILLETTRGVGDLSGSVAGLVGSFDTFGGAVTTQGTAASLSYSGSVSRFVTSNDAAFNDFKAWNYSTRIEYAATPELLVGATFRGQNAHYEEPGSRLFPSPGTVDADNYLTTAFAQLRVSDAITSRVTLALHHRDYTFGSQYGVSDLKNLRKILDWQNTWQASRQLEIVAGANFERSSFTVDGGRSKDEVGAGYVSATARPIDTVTLTGGVRYDDFKSVGSATTWRTGAAWRPVTATKLHATYGTGFSAPGSDDRYGVPEFGQLPNPGLRPEKSRGWDAGVDQDLLGGKAMVSATYFHNRFTDLFEWEYVDFVTFQGRTVNRARATTSGLEFAATGRLTSGVKARLGYTYLDAKDDGNGRRLIRRPRHVLDAELRAQPIKPWIVGLGLHGVMDRREGAGRIEDYTTVRLFTSYAVNEHLIVKARVENALNESYEEVLGYASLPRGIFGSVEWRF